MEEARFESDTRFLFRILWDIIKLPFVLVLVMFGKREGRDLAQPLRDIWDFIWAAKATTWLIIVTTLVTFWAWLLAPAGAFDALARYPVDILQPWRWYSFITCGFIHIDLGHIGWNMFALFLFGRVVERRLGPGKVLALYGIALVVSSAVASIFELIMHTALGGSVGASGAIAGLVAAAMLLDPFYITYDALIPLPVMLSAWLGIVADASGLIGVSDHISHSGHVAGYLSVTVMLFVLAPEEKKRMKRGLIINAVSLVVFGLLYLYF